MTKNISKPKILNKYIFYFLLYYKTIFFTKKSDPVYPSGTLFTQMSDMHRKIACLISD